MAPLPLPYAGLRVLDMSQGLAGPYCAGLLGMQGAKVIKVEPPGGDWIRAAGGGREGMTSLAIMGSPGKRSACIDATRPEGKALLLRLAKNSDVFVQNFRPGVIERLGLDYETLASDNPSLVYVSVTGFGPSGPDARKAATDSVIQAFTGIAAINRAADGTPRRIPFLVPDTVTGVYAAQATGAALYARATTGQGRHVHVSLMDACAALQAAPILDAVMSDGQPATPITVPSGIFKTSDGFVTLTSLNEKMFASLVKVLGVEDLGRDERFATLDARKMHAVEFNLEVSRRIINEATATWLEKFAAADVLCAAVLDYAGFLDAPQTRHRQTFGDIDQPPYGKIPLPRVPGGTPDWPLGPAPKVGEHTLEILAEFGVTEAECAKLLASGVIKQAA